MSTSSNERGMSLRSPARFLAAAERLVQLWKDNPDNRSATFADRVADAWIKAQAYRLQTFGTVTRLAGGGELGAESSVTKVFWSDLDVAIHQTALDLRGRRRRTGRLVDRRPTCSRSAARSTPAPTRFSATSSPSGCWACPERRSEMNFELDEQQRDFAASIDAALGAADLPGGGARLGRRRHRPRPQGLGDSWPTSASPRWPSARSTTASGPPGRPGGGAGAPRRAGACPARSPNPSPSHRFCSPTTSAAPRWPPVS